MFTSSNSLLPLAGVERGPIVEEIADGQLGAVVESELRQGGRFVRLEGGRAGAGGREIGHGNGIRWRPGRRAGGSKGRAGPVGGGGFSVVHDAISAVGHTIGLTINDILIVILFLAPFPFRRAFPLVYPSPLPA